MVCLRPGSLFLRRAAFGCAAPPATAGLRTRSGDAALHAHLLRRDDLVSFFEVLLSVLPARRLALCDKVGDGGWCIMRYVETLAVPVWRPEVQTQHRRPMRMQTRVFGDSSALNEKFVVLNC